MTVKVVTYRGQTGNISAGTPSVPDATAPRVSDSSVSPRVRQSRGSGVDPAKLVTIYKGQSGLVRRQQGRPAELVCLNAIHGVLCGNSGPQGADVMSAAGSCRRDAGAFC